MATTTEKKWDNKELGALWRREKNGTKEKYLTGTLNLKSLGAGFPDKDVPVVIFSNKFKQKDSHPDLRVYLSERKPTGDAEGSAAPRSRTTASAPTPAPQGSGELI